MKCLAFFANGKVLKANGSYQCINKISKGDHVINMYGKPVRVRRVIASESKDIVHFKSDLWYDKSSLKCTGDQQFLMSNERSVFLPNKIDWMLPHGFHIDSIYQSQQLGFIFGAFLRVGYVRNDKRVCFHCDTSQVCIVNKIKTIVNKLFDEQPTNNSSQHWHTLVYNNEYLYKLFLEFSCEPNKCLPEKYYCTDKEFALGLLTGLICTGTQGQPPILPNEKVFEGLYWSALSSNTPSLRGEFHWQKNTDDLETVWSLDVECTTKTFIINNIVAKL